MPVANFTLTSDDRAVALEVFTRRRPGPFLRFGIERGSASLSHFASLIRGQPWVAQVALWILGVIHLMALRCDEFMTA